MLEPNNQTIQGLHASSPDPKLREKLELFGQFAGDWDIVENRFFETDGSEVVQSGELHWGWILDGKAMQDVWMYNEKKSKRAIPAGTTVRFYDPEIDAWRSTWISAIQNEVLVFIGRKAGDEIVLEGTSKKGVLLKWVFFNIRSDSFEWRGELSGNGGKSWRLEEKMLIRRRR